MSVSFRHYLSQHKDLKPEPPSRIIPISRDVAEVKWESGAPYVEVKNVPRNAHLTLVEGVGRGVSSIDDKPVPLNSPKVIEDGVKASEEGTYKFKLPAAVADTKDPEKQVCVIAMPAGMVSAKNHAVFSYPVMVLPVH
jgi:hypothetical protein